MAPRDSNTADLYVAPVAVSRPVVLPATPIDPDEPPASDVEACAAYRLFKSEIIVDAEHALHEEYKLFFGPPKDSFNFGQWLTSNPRYALCLSGGGIRSAAFCMGALRALAQRKLLIQFHYLSTVSGGGYIGGWLQCLVKEAQAESRKAKAKIEAAQATIEVAQARIREPQAVIAELQAKIEEAQAVIEKASPDSQAHPAAAAQDILASSQARPQVKNLRDFTNFLAPTPGLLSGDVMPGVVLYMRNVIVNWMIFLPALMFVALGPTFYRDLICALAADGHAPAWDVRTGFALLACAIGLFALGLGVLNGCECLPTHSHDFTPPKNQTASDQADGDADMGRLGPDAKEITRRVIKPILVWALAAPIALAAMSPPPEAVKPAVDDAALSSLPRIDEVRRAIAASWHEWAFPVAMVLVMIGAFEIARHRVRARVPVDKQDEHVKVFDDNFWYWAIACGLSGGVMYAVIAMGNFARAEEYATFGPLLVLIAVVLQTTFYVAVRRDPLLADLDREWLGRLNASLLNWGVIGAGVAACSLIAPYWLLAGKANGLTTVATIIGIASGPVAAGMARKAAMFLEKPDGLAASLGFRLFDVMALLAALLFAASLLALLSWGGQDLVDRIADTVDGQTTVSVVSWLVVVLVTLVFGALLAFVAWWLGSAINVNRFSMHSVYRNRLVRAFLGSSRNPSERRPDRFVRFDPNDNPRMTELKRGGAEGSPPCLFPVIGATLNLSGGTRTAWTERKAAPFTITPLRCGSAELNHPQIAAALKRESKRWNLGAIPIMGGWTDTPPSGAYARTGTYSYCVIKPLPRFGGVCQ